MSEITKEQREKAIEEGRDMTLPEWCAKRNISLPTFYKMDRMGLAPETYEVPVVRGKRITPAADARWEKKMYALGKTKAAKREAERRRKPGAHAGKIAAQSPLHVSKRGFKKAPPNVAPPATKPSPKRDGLNALKQKPHTVARVAS